VGIAGTLAMMLALVLYICHVKYQKVLRKNQELEERI
jgi:hypothetical protein